MTHDGPVTFLSAAGQGLGAAIARELHQAGHRLVLLGPDDATGIIANELGALVVTGSVTSDPDVEAAVNLAITTWGRIDNAVVNTPRSTTILRETIGDISGLVDVNARTMGYDPDFAPELTAIPPEAFARCHDLHVLPLVRVARAVTPFMQRAGKGALVAISGMDAAQPRLTFPLGPVRLALHGYAKLYADRYGRDGIRINCYAPGVLENSQSTDPNLVRMIPMQRLGGLREAAQTVAFLLSGAAEYITGQVITADGGMNRTL